MKIINCNQRGADWFSARLGKPTASGMAEIVTTTGKVLRLARHDGRQRFDFIGVAQ